MARRKKDLENIDKEMQSQVSVVETLKDGEVSIDPKTPKGVLSAHEFGDEYTMEVIADNEPGADQFRIPNKDPKFEYRYLRDDKTNMGVKTSNLLYMKGGWQIVPTSHLMKIGFKKENLQPDGSYKVGELILAFMPKKYFDMKMLKDKKTRDEAMSDVQSLMSGKSRIKQEGVVGISTGSIKKGPLNYGTHNEVDE